MAFSFNTLGHGVVDLDVLHQWRRLHEILSGGPAAVVDDVTVRRELDALLERLDAIVLVDRDTKDAFLAFSSGLAKILSSFVHSRAALLQIKDLKQRINYSSAKCQSLLASLKRGVKFPVRCTGIYRSCFVSLTGLTLLHLPSLMSTRYNVSVSCSVTSTELRTFWSIRLRKVIGFLNVQHHWVRLWKTIFLNIRDSLKIRRHINLPRKRPNINVIFLMPVLLIASSSNVT